jgi:hypothetical protein
MQPFFFISSKKDELERHAPARTTFPFASSSGLSCEPQMIEALIRGNAISRAPCPAVYSPPDKFIFSARLIFPRN